LKVLIAEESVMSGTVLVQYIDILRGCSGHGHWLQWDRRVLEHDFPRRTGPLLLHFAVR